MRYRRMAARLKTFAWSDGLTEYAVATSSRPKALAAWDSDIDLFKTGLAHETEDAGLVEAANASPGEVITRPVSGGPAKALKAAKRATPASKPTAAQRRLEGLKAELAALEAAQAEEAEALEVRRAALDAEAQALEARQERAREAVEKKLAAARAEVG
jgi:vacuolar-type H+-ATPase subunit I/STV1